MTEEVRGWIQEEKLIQPGDTVLVGVSGGADSVCLLILLQEYQREMEFALQAVHVEHGIRGEESKEDARFVEALCERIGVPLHLFSVDVPSYARKNRIGIEEAARELRYRCFGETVAKNQGTKVRVALAHHADDNAETVLFQMARGSGVRGLSGMRSMREASDGVTYIRPLLGTTRLQIEEYLQMRGEGYCIDSTNLDTNYSRNRIRHQVLPALKEINPQAVLHITQSASRLGELADYVENQAREITGIVCEKKSDAWLVKSQLFEQYPLVLQKEVIYQMISELAGSRKDIANIHVESVCQLIGLQVGRRISLPYSLFAERVYEGIYLSKASVAAATQSEQYTISLKEIEVSSVNGWYELPLEDGVLRMKVHDFAGEMHEIPKKAYTKLLNYDKIKCGLQFRKRVAGDYLTIDNEGHRKKLKEYFVEEKVPRELRDDMWLLTEGAHVLWIVGKRISADYKLDQNTRKVLEIHMSGGKYSED